MKMPASKHIIGGVLGTLVITALPLAMRAAPPGKPHGPGGAGGHVTLVPIHPINMKAAAKVSWAKDIHPLLNAQCLPCHASGARKAAGLDVTTIPALLKGGESGPSVIPGKPDKSSLVLYIEGLRKPQMPMRHKAMSAAQLHLIREWIAAGAKAH